MVEKFIPDVRKLFKDAGYMKIDNSRERAGAFLVGIRGDLFQVDSDLQVGSAENGLMAVGCGGQVALEASERGSAGVRGGVQDHPDGR